MSVLGYSELLKEIFEIQQEKLENEIQALIELKPSKLRLDFLRGLAQREGTTISEILRHLHYHHTGGTYKAIFNFLKALERTGMIRAERHGRRTRYRYTTKATNLKRWLVES